MKLSIIIVHYRNPAILKLCLNSIFKFPPSFEYEVIVVDSQTYRESRDLIKESFPEVKLISKTENTGYPKGVNLGIHQSKGEYILVLNPDIVIMENTLDKLVEFIEKRPDIGLMGPQLLNFDGSIQNSYFHYYTPLTIAARRIPLGKIWPLKKTLKYFMMTDSDHNKIQAPDWIMGSAMFTSRMALEKVGLMDERFFMYFEDVDWSRRFWQNGYKVIYYPEAKMYHAHKRESKSRLWIADIFFNQATRWHIASAIKYFWKYKFTNKSLAN